MNRRWLDGLRSFNHQSSVPLVLGMIMSWLVTSSKINDAHNSSTNNKLLVRPQLSTAVDFRQRLSDHIDVRILFANVELVKALITNVVSHVFDNEKNRCVGIADDLPSFNHGVTKSRERVVCRQLLKWKVSGVRWGKFRRTYVFNFIPMSQLL